MSPRGTEHTNVDGEYLEAQQAMLVGQDDVLLPHWCVVAGVAWNGEREVAEATNRAESSNKIICEGCEVRGG